jgi:ADP-ribose pyrophosphatase YjhB (NUDIX family)
MTEALSNEPNPAFTGVVSAVVALVRDENGRVLLASPSESGPWSCIGGGVVDGQDLASAAIKFAREDCGLTVELGDVVAELTGDQYRVLYECGADTTYRATVYDARLIDEDVPAPLRANWFTPAQLSSLSLDEFATAALSGLHLL